MMPDSWRLESCADWRSARVDWMDLVREGHGIVELGISYLTMEWSGVISLSLFVTFFVEQR